MGWGGRINPRGQTSEVASVPKKQKEAESNHSGQRPHVQEGRFEKIM